MSFSLGLTDWAISLVVLSSSNLFGLYRAVRKKSAADSALSFGRPQSVLDGRVLGHEKKRSGNTGATDDPLETRGIHFGGIFDRRVQLGVLTAITVTLFWLLWQA
jgi:hypothetical protein